MVGKMKISHSVFPTHNGVLSHGAAFVATIGFVIYTSSEKVRQSSSEFVDTTVRFIHLFTFATWVGIQFWVHVSGFAMYKTLKRTAFAAVQGKMFPMYFTAGFVMSSVALLSHLRLNPVLSWEGNKLAFYQTVGLIISLVCSLLNLTYLGPGTIHLVQLRAERLKVLGIQDGIGPVCMNLVKGDAEYMALRKSFLKMHMFCSLVNLLCYGACGINIWCLASKQTHI